MVNDGQYSVTGWWLSQLRSKMMEFVSWDDDIPNIWKNKSHVPNHQPGNVCNDVQRARVNAFVDCQMKRDACLPAFCSSSLATRMV